MSENLGTNVNYEVKGDILTMTVDLSKEFGLSNSKKTTRIASTEGNVKIPGTAAVIGLNVYKKKA